MTTQTTTYRVLYADTDKMGYFYHGNYTRLFEIGRTDMLRKAGFTYKKLEETGFMLPIIDLQMQFHSPAFYDDELIITTTLEAQPTLKFIFSFAIHNQAGTLLCTGKTVLVCADATTRKAAKTPNELILALESLQ